MATCKMCNTVINPDAPEFKLKHDTPEGEPILMEVCGRCNMLTHINDNLLELQFKFEALRLVMLDR